MTQKRLFALYSRNGGQQNSPRFFGWPFSETEFLDKISELLKTLDLPSTFLQAKLVQREEVCDSPLPILK